MSDIPKQQIRTYIITLEHGPEDYLAMAQAINGDSLHVVLVNLSNTLATWIDSQRDTMGYADCVVMCLSERSADLLDEIQQSKLSHPTKPPFMIMVSHDPAMQGKPQGNLLLPIMSPLFLANVIATQVPLYLRYLQLQRGVHDLELLKNAIVHNVSHELKPPLLQVKSAIHLLAEETTDNQLTEMAIQSTARLESIVKNITLLSDTIQDKFSPILIQESIEHAIRHLRRSHQHKNDLERVTIQIDPQTPPVWGDKQSISIVIQHLLDNALKFSKEQVDLKVVVLDEHVEISVIDRGIGIERDKFNRIFESFYQVDSSTTRRYNGVGVGLAIAKYIVERHESHISVASTPQHGSVFSFKMKRCNFRP
ncbi:MAG: sensor histidine kinase [Phototrophicaceae bacterium]